MSTFDWSTVDNHINFIATDADGATYGFSKEPLPSGWSQRWWVRCRFTVLISGYTSEKPWEDSLMKRPVTEEKTYTASQVDSYLKFTGWSSKGINSEDLEYYVTSVLIPSQDREKEAVEFLNSLGYKVEKTC
jgi:hypothetical protein